MLALAQQDYIRFLRQKESASINEIAKRVQINWRTAKKYADKEDWNIPEEKPKKRCHIMEPYLDIVRTWLMEDKRLPAKQRHTAKRIYERLKNEHGYTGSDRTVRTHVARIKAEIFAPEKKTSIKLDHPPGEAQADFGTMKAFYEGELRDFKYLVLTLPQSNDEVVQVYPGENSECFLDGLRRIFEFLGGSPTKLRIDNLSAAVVKVLEGPEREETEMFKRFRLHYGFEAQFCNKGAGNEKGNVENKVGTFRRNWFVPIPHIHDLEEFNRKLLECCVKDRKRIHYEKGKTVEELLQADLNALLKLPNTPFEAYRLDTAVVNRYGQIIFDGFTYESIPAKPGERVRIKATWDKLEISLNGRIIAERERQYGLKREQIDWLYHLKLLKSKPRALEYSMYRSFLPETIQDYLLKCDLTTRKERLSHLCRWLGSYSMDQIANVLASSNKKDWENAPWLEHRLYNIIAKRPDPLKEQHTPESVLNYNPDPHCYNALLPEVGHDE